MTAPGHTAAKAWRYLGLYGPARRLAKVRARGALGAGAVAVERRAHPRQHIGIIGCGNFALATIAHYLPRGSIRAAMDVDPVHAVALARAREAAYATTDAARALGLSGPVPLTRAMARIEMTLYRSAALVVALTPAFKTRLIERGVSAQKIAVTPSGVDRTAFVPRANFALKTELAAQRRFLIAYVGTHGLAHGLAPMITAMADLPEAHLLLVGDGAVKPALAEAARHQARPSVTLWPQVPRARVPGIIAGADAMLVPLRRASVFRTVIASKIFEAAAVEKPILLGAEGQSRAIVEQYGAGLAFTPEDGGGFAAAVRTLIADPERARAMGQGGAALAAAYDRRKLAAEMLDVLRAVAKEA